MFQQRPKRALPKHSAGIAFDDVKRELPVLNFALPTTVDQVKALIERGDQEEIKDTYRALGGRGQVAPDLEDLFRAFFGNCGCFDD